MGDMTFENALKWKREAFSAMGFTKEELFGVGIVL